MRDACARETAIAQLRAMCTGSRERGLSCEADERRVDFRSGRKRIVKHASRISHINRTVGRRRESI
jgi:hypothetical protein